MKEIDYFEHMHRKLPWHRRLRWRLHAWLYEARHR